MLQYKSRGYMGANASKQLNTPPIASAVRLIEFSSTLFRGFTGGSLAACGQTAGLIPRRKLATSPQRSRSLPRRKLAQPSRQNRLNHLRFIFTLIFVCLIPAIAPAAQPAHAAPPSASVTPFTILPYAEQISFAVIGDYGRAGVGAESVADLVHSWQPDFIITTGDNNYPSGAAETIDPNIGQYYSDYIAPYTGEYGSGAGSTIADNRFFPSLGNHDWQTNDAQPYLNYFTLPPGQGGERYYEFVAGSVHFFAVDGDYSEPDGFRADSVQGVWLQNALAASASPWQVVYFHMPPYSSGHHGANEVMRWPFAAWGADAVLSGHDHHYERLLVDGLLYFVNGAGGGGLYELGNIDPNSQFRYNRDYGAMLVTVTESEMTFAFYAVSDPQTPVDTYTLTQ